MNVFFIRYSKIFEYPNILYTFFPPSEQRVQANLGHSIFLFSAFFHSTVDTFPPEGAVLKFYMQPRYKISLFSCLCSIRLSFMLWSYQNLKVNLDLNQIKLLLGFWNSFYLLSEYTMDKLKERSTSFEPTGDILIQSPNWAFPVTYYIQI